MYTPKINDDFHLAFSPDKSICFVVGKIIKTHFTFDANGLTFNQICFSLHMLKRIKFNVQKSLLRVNRIQSHSN